MEAEVKTKMMLKAGLISAIAMVSIMAFTGVGYAADWYVAPETFPRDSARPSGSLENPWYIESALLSGAVGPGDTIWIRGGTYYNPNRTPNYWGYGFSLQGTSEAPIVVRAYPNERATIDGGLQTSGTPRHVRIQDLEIIVSENLTESRFSPEEGSHPTFFNRPRGGVTLVYGHDIKVINNVIHDNFQGISFWSTVSGDSEIYGNLVYDNGWESTDRYHGHGFYTQNSSGDWKYIRNNISFGNYSLPFKVYGESFTALLDRYVIERNFFMKGSNSDDDRLIVGGPGDIPDHIMFLNNVIHGSKPIIGFTVGTNDAVVAENMIIYHRSLSTPNNTNLTRLNNFRWNGTTTTATVEGVQVPIPSSPSVFLNPNIYDSNRANLAILAFPGQTTAQVDMGSLLVNGESQFDFHLKDPSDFYGASVYVGTYSGSPVSIPITGEFTTYVVLKNGEIGGPPRSEAGNSLPEAHDDAYSTALDTVLDRAAPGVLGNDTDADGDTISSLLVTQATHGTVNLSNDGAFIYMPDAGFRGTDGFTYRLNDGTTFSTMGTVAIQVGPPQTSAINFNDYAILSYAGSDQDMVGPVTIEDNGSTLHLAGNRFKAIEFPYYISENTILEFDFRSGNQGEIHAIGFDTDLLNSVTQRFILYGTQDGATEAIGFDDDYDGTEPNTKNYEIPIGQFYKGPKSYLFFVNDHDAYRPPESDPLEPGEGYFSNVKIYEVSPGNTPPIAANDGPETTDENTAITIDVLANDYDLDGTIDPATVIVTSDPANGATIVNGNGTVTYTPADDFSGTNTFGYTVNDNEGAVSNEATVTITVGPEEPVNYPPVAQSQSVSTAQDTTVDITLVATDQDPGDTLTYSIVEGPDPGTLAGTAPNVTYTPDAGHVGGDSFTFKANDGQVDSDTAAVTITVNSEEPHPGDVAYIATDVENDGSATYTFNIEEEAQYVIWCRIQAENSSSDSFWVSVDGNRQVYDTANEEWDDTGWRWTPLTYRISTSPLQLEPRIFNFSVGSHTIIFEGREVDANGETSKLDKFIVTSDLRFIPTDDNITDQLTIEAEFIEGTDMLVSPMRVYSETAELTLGDVDKDSAVTIKDAILVARYVAGIDVGEDFNEEAADVNRVEGQPINITMADAILIAQMAVGTER